MTRQPEPTGEQLEAVYQSMIGALARRDVGQLDSLLADEVEFRSYATVKATRDRIYDPVILSFEHLGDGWLIAVGRLRHTAEGGWMADGRKAALARVIDAKVRVSLASSTADEARAEFAARQADRSGRS
jgi:hypothetical protein